MAWTGSHAGRFRAPATARWCAGDSVLEVVAARGDTAVGFAVWAADTSPATAVYPIVAPAIGSRVDAPRRRQASAAVRWFGGTLIYGFEATSGTVEITEAGRGRVTGSLDAGLRLAAGGDTLSLRATFRGLAVTPATEPCGRQP